MVDVLGKVRLKKRLIYLHPQHGSHNHHVLSRSVVWVYVHGTTTTMYSGCVGFDSLFHDLYIYPILLIGVDDCITERCSTTTSHPFSRIVQHSVRPMVLYANPAGYIYILFWLLCVHMSQWGGLLLRVGMPWVPSLCQFTLDAIAMAIGQ